MHAYSTADWESFFTAIAGAAAALALVPQNIHLLGAEILVVAVPLFAVTLRNTVRYQRQNPNSPLVPTALLGIAGAIYGAWILLVEIAR